MSLTFHRTFSLSRPSITKIIQLAKGKPDFKREDLSKNTDLGSVYQEAMPRYAQRAGLLDKDNRLTTFGNFVSEYDPMMEKTATQWLLHYHLSAPHRQTAFWHHLVVRRFLPGNTFTTADLTKDLTDFLHVETGKAPASRSVRSTIAIFTSTYLKPDGLGSLGLLEKLEKDSYRVPFISPPPFWALGYALAEFWQAYYNGRLTIDLENLLGPSFSSLFLLGEEGLTQLLLELKHEGMLDLYRISHPYQVVLLQPNPDYALEKVYAP